MLFIKGLLLHLYLLVLAVIPTDRYVEGVVGQPATFFPHQAKTSTDRTISGLIYRGLFKYDIYGSIIPDLAQTWMVSPDGLVYTIKIKDNQYWSNGKKINADDLIYTAFKSPDLSGVATDKVDDLTVRYTLPNRYAPFLNLLTIGVMPSNAEEKQNGLDPITSGDFGVASIERNGSLVRKVVLVTTKDEYNIKRLIFRYYSNNDELLTAAKLGEIDGFLSSEVYEEKELENFEDYKFPLQGTYYGLFFNLRNDNFKDVAVRQDLEKVLPINRLILDKGIAVQGPISRSLFTDMEVNFDKYDKDAKPDLNNKNFVITVPDVPGHKEFVSRIKEIWESTTGVDIDIKMIDREKMMSDVIEPRNFEILFFGHEVGRDPDRYVLWHSAQKDTPGLNITGFDHVRADRALEEGRNEQDNDKRVVHYNEFQKVVSEQTPAIFLYHPYTHYYVSKYISGIGEKYTFTYADRFLDFANWKRIDTN